MQKNKGFTLIELLVVIAIIGLLSTMAVIALSSARAKSRDAKRISDIKQIQTSLEMYLSDIGAYPIEADAIELGSANFDCLDEDGIVAACDAGGTTYMATIPAAPTPPTGNVYTYAISDGSTYSITFTLEGVTGSLAAGAHTASPAGVQ